MKGRDAHNDEPVSTPAATPGQEVVAGSVLTRFEVTGAMSGGAFCIVRQWIRAGQLFWPHTHTRETQVVIVLSGRLTVRVGDDVRDAGPGDLVWRKPGIPHTVWNSGEQAAEIIEITSPGRFDEYLMELAALTTTGEPAAELQRRWGISDKPEWETEIEQRFGVHL